MISLNFHSILSGITIIALFLCGLFCLAYWFVKWQRKQNIIEDEYENLYKEIQNDIFSRAVVDHSYDVIIYKLGKLGHLKWKNKEKTSVLFTQFLMKYKEIAEEIASLDEFSPESVFGK